MPPFPLRLMTKDDLSAINALQTEAYAPNYHESKTSFAAKQLYYPQGAWIAETGGAIAGYLFSHPWKFGEPPPLDAPELCLDLAPDCYYLHDITVVQRLRGQGLAAAFIAKGEDLAREVGLNRVAMTSVQGTREIWGKFGYHTVDLQGPPQEKLQSYGQGAVYLVKIL